MIRHLLGYTGYSYFFLGEFIHKSGRHKASNFFYAALQYTFLKNEGQRHHHNQNAENEAESMHRHANARNFPQAECPHLDTL